MILAGDIGGTKTRLALYDWKDRRVDAIREEFYYSHDYESLEEVLTEFLEEEPANAPDIEAEDTITEKESTVAPDSPSNSLPTLTSACFGVAGPVLKNLCRTTNLPWVVDGKRVAEHLKIRRAQLLNDLEATAYGLQGT